MSYVGEAAIVPRQPGLTVEQAMTRAGAPVVCGVCHRQRVNYVCGCRSHPDDFSALVADTPRLKPGGRAWTAAETAHYVNAARDAWLERDWNAVERLIRGLCAA